MSSIHPHMCLFVFFPLFPEVTTGHIARIYAELPQGCKLEGVFLVQRIVFSAIQAIQRKLWIGYCKLFTEALGGGEEKGL